MTHSKTTRRVALLATTALVGSAFAAAPVAAQGDSSACDGEYETPVTLKVSVHTGAFLCEGAARAGQYECH